MKECSVCGVYYRDEHTCGPVEKIGCPVCGMSVSYFHGASKWGALANHQATGNCAGMAGVSNTSAVNHPAHYTSGSIECLDAMESAFGKEAVENFAICSAFKYVFRHKGKNGKEDLQKAIWYLRYATGDDPRRT